MYVIKNSSPFYLKMHTNEMMRTHATRSCFLVYLCYIFLFFFQLEKQTNKQKI